MRISITAEAYLAMCATLPFGSVMYEPEVNADGERMIWLEPAAVDKLVTNDSQPRRMAGASCFGGRIGVRVQPGLGASQKRPRRSGAGGAAAMIRRIVLALALAVAPASAGPATLTCKRQRADAIRCGRWRCVDKLARLRREGETFRDVILRLAAVGHESPNVS
jgi:hypothetical protein